MTQVRMIANFPPLRLVLYVAGEAESRYDVGLTSAEGLGTRRDAVEAAHWFRIFANKGYPPAQYALAHMHRTGKSVPRDDVDQPRLHVRAWTRRGPGPMRKPWSGIAERPSREALTHRSISQSCTSAVLVCPRTMPRRSSGIMYFFSRGFRRTTSRRTNGSISPLWASLLQRPRSALRAIRNRDIVARKMTLR